MKTGGNPGSRQAVRKALFSWSGPPLTRLNGADGDKPMCACRQAVDSGDLDGEFTVLERVVDVVQLSLAR